MPIVASDILIKGSVVTGSAGNSTAQTVAGQNLGKYMSTTQVADATANNLFPDVTGDENAASQVDYQCLFVHNNHATLAYQNVVVWLSAEVAGGVSCAISVDTTAASAAGSATAQAKQIADKNTAPTSQTFTSPTSKATGLSIGTLNAGQVRAVWVRRTAANSAALNNDGVTLSWSGDTAA
jgi:hypothetical protein